MTDAPSSIGPYEVVSPIGQGGMGMLLLAWDPRLERQVAIKLLRDDDDELRERFKREARAVARLKHVNIVTIFDVGEHDGQPYIAMEYVDGQTLAEIVRHGGPVSVAQRLHWIEELCSGLGFAHHRGIVHRDVKPANIMVSRDGPLKILDFGIARAVEASGMTLAGMLIGTLNYMSPEQVTGQAVDHRSDIFAVGAVLYEVLTHHQAFPGNLQTGILHRILSGEPEPILNSVPDLDPEIAHIVERAMEKSPETRYQDLDLMRRDLMVVRARLEGLPTPSTIVPVSDTPAPVGGRNLSPSDRQRLFAKRAEEIEGHLQRARQAAEARDYQAAEDASEQALLLDPNDSRALDLLEEVRRARDRASSNEWLTAAEREIQGGTLTAARALVDRAAELTPDLARVAEVRTVLEEARRRRDDASSNEWLTAAEREIAEGGLTAARVLVDRASELTPDLSRVAAVRSSLDDAWKGREEARRRAVAIEDALTAARTSLDQGRFDEALESVGKALAEEPAHADALALRARIGAAAAVARAADHLAAGRLAEADEAASAAMTEDGGDQAAKKIRGRVDKAIAAALNAARQDARRRLKDGDIDGAERVLADFTPVTAAVREARATLAEQIRERLDAQSAKTIVMRPPPVEPKPAGPGAAPEVEPATPPPPAPPPEPEFRPAEPAVAKGESPASPSTRLDRFRHGPDVATRGEAEAKPVASPPLPSFSTGLASQAGVGSGSRIWIGGGAAAVVVLAVVGYLVFGGHPRPEPPQVAESQETSTVASTTTVPPEPADTETTTPAAPATTAPARQAAPPAPSSPAPRAAVDESTAQLNQELTRLRSRAQQALMRGNREQAAGLAQTALERRPSDPGTHLMLTRWLASARQDMAAARTKASDAGEHARSSDDFQRATQLESQSNARAAQDPLGAVRAAWSAQALFEQAAGAPAPVPPVSVAAATTTSTPVSPAEPKAEAGRTPAAPPPAAPPAPVDDDAAIRRTLEAYADAMSRLDVAGVRRVFPSAPARELRSSFDQMKSQSVEVREVKIRRNGSNATVAASLRQSFTPKVGSGQTVSVTAEFDMQRNDGIWIILRRR